MGRPAQYAKQWKAKFIQDIKDMISETNTPITIFDMFNIYKKKYGKKKYSMELIQNLLKIATESGEITYFDIKLPTDKPVAIFPGRHPVNSTIFLYLISQEYEKSVEKAKNLLNSLIKAAQGEINENLPKPSENTDSDANKIDKPTKVKMSRSISQDKILQFDYYSQKMIRLQILHSFITNTYKKNTFSISSLINDAPIDLLFKICKVKAFPTYILQEPRLRFIQFRYFPRQIQDLMKVDGLKRSIEKLVELLQQYGLVSKIKNTYKCSKYAQIVFNDKFSSKLNLFEKTNFEYFWHSISLLDLIENIDPSMQMVWLEKWSMYRKLDFPESPLTTQIIKNCNPNKENITQLTGIERIFVKQELPEKNIKTDLNFFEENVDFIEDPKSFQLINFKKSIDINKNDFLSAFCTIVAFSSVTCGGIHVRSAIEWSKVTEMMTSLFDKTESVNFYIKLHQNNLFFSEGYENLFVESVSFAISAAKGIFDVLPLSDNNMTVSEIYKYFTLSNLLTKTTLGIGEIIEGLKRRFFTKMRYYNTKNCQKFLSEYNWNYAKDGLIYLKLINFITKIGTNFIRTKIFQHGNLFSKNFFSEILKIDKLHREYNIHQLPYFSPDSTDCLFFKLILENSILPTLSTEDFSKDKIIDHNSNLIHLRIQKLLFPKLQVEDGLNLQIPKQISVKNDDICLTLQEDVKRIINLSQKMKKNHLIEMIFVYSYIMFSHEEGIDFLTLKEYTKISIDDDFVLAYCLNFLMNFSFVFRISSSSCLPCFISSSYLNKKSPRIGHIYTRIDGQTSLNLSNELTIEVFDKIFKNNSIEFLELLELVPHISASDLLVILNALICDEAIKCVEMCIDVNLTESNYNCHFLSDDILFCFYIWQHQIDPTMNRPCRYYSVTNNEFLNLSFLSE